MKLSPHFSLNELTRSTTAIRLGVDNLPDEVSLENLNRLVALLEKVRAAFGGLPVRITSGFRSIYINGVIGGSSTSSHCFGLAVDFTIPGVENIDVCRWIETNLPECDQIIYEFGADGWVHLGLAHEGKTPRRQSLSALRRGGRTVYVPQIKECA